ncbi:hypothetical protein L3X38_037019 [Prunus dulcis]|uniref:Transposable element protein n=1 Tax=Prunus dulcis TaxID=3755 RepID=A0AAD4V4N0_PRUDU|nr:hypothetical protein L3X38_037019 [Prunus dulcis]
MLLGLLHPFPAGYQSQRKIKAWMVQINIPLLNAIAQIPKYANFLKDLCTNKRRFKEHEQVALNEELSAVLQRKLPLELKDPDRIIRYPKGILEDVLVKVEELILPADFLVLEMEEAPIHDNQLPLILGRPFMATAGAIIDVKKGENETLPVIIASHLGPNDENKLLRVLKEHKTAIGWSIAAIKGISPTLCMHKILLEDNAMPKRDAQRCLNPNMKEVVRKEVMKLLNVGIIYPISDSKWVSPVQVVPKKSGITVVKNEANELVPTWMTTAWRVCIDYRKLNTATSKDHFPFPFIDQMLERLAGHSHYCFLDGYSGYNQITIAPEDQEKTTFTCPFGTFTYRRMPFGLCNAPATFQRYMMSIFSDMVERFIEVFVDDFPVFGDSFDQCLHNLSKVLARCEQTNPVLNWEKCHFMVNQGIVLGHVISNKGIEVDKAKIDLIASMPSPTSVKEVRFFLGHAGFYRRFIKDFSKIASLMCNLLAKDMDFVFDQDYENAFNALKKMLTTAPIIIPPDWSLPFELMCDASDYAVGAVLGQRIDKKPHAIYYASRTLNDAQLNYSTTEKELLAVIFALEKFRSYLNTNRRAKFTVTIRSCDRDQFDRPIETKLTGHPRYKRYLRDLLAGIAARIEAVSSRPARITVRPARRVWTVLTELTDQDLRWKFWGEMSNLQGRLCRIFGVGHTQGSAQIPKWNLGWILSMVGGVIWWVWSEIQSLKLCVDAQNGPANIESNLVMRYAGSSAGKRAEALGEIGLAVGSFGRCLAPRKCVFLQQERRRGCLGASRFGAGSARFTMV